MSDSGAVSTTELAEASEAPEAKRARGRTRSSSSIKSSNSLGEEGKKGATQEEKDKEGEDASALQPNEASHNGIPSPPDADSAVAPVAGADLAAPKRPTGGGYGIFLKENREEIKKSLPADHRITEVTKAAGVRWKALSDDEKLPYQARFKEDFVEYKRRMSLEEHVALPKRSGAASTKRKGRIPRSSSRKEKAASVAKVETENNGGEAAKTSSGNASEAREKNSSRRTTKRRSSSTRKRRISVPKVGIAARLQKERRLREKATTATTPLAVVAALVGNVQLSVQGSKEFSKARGLCRLLTIRCVFCRFLLESAKPNNVRFCENFFSCQSGRHLKCDAKVAPKTADDTEAGQSSWACKGCVETYSAPSPVVGSACTSAAGIVVEPPAPPQRSRSASQASASSRPRSRSDSQIGFPEPPP